MKKIILPLILCASAFFYVSCSTDSSDLSTDSNSNSSVVFNTKTLNTIDLEQAKKLFLDLYETQEYKDYLSSVTAINDKIQVYDIQDNLVTKKDWLNWVQNHISETSFSSINEFEIMFDDSANRLHTIMDDNATLYGYIAGANSSQLTEIYTPSIPSPEPPVSNNNECVENCMDLCSAAIDRLIDNEFKAIEDAFYAGATYQELTSIKTLYANRYFGLITQLNNCIARCPQ